jgi:hypothetical protein
MKTKTEILKDLLECSPDAVSLMQAIMWHGIELKQDWKPVYRLKYYIDDILQHTTKWLAGHPTKEMRERAQEMDLDASILSGKFHLTTFDCSFRGPDREVLGDDADGIWLDA